PTEDRAQEFILGVYFSEQKGQFFDDDFDKERQVSLTILEQTLKNPERTQKDLDDSNRLLRQNRDTAGQEIVRRISELKRAQEIVAFLKPSIQAFSTFLRSLLQQPDVKTGKTLGDFLREAAVVQQFFPVVSERIERRLVASMEKIAGHQDAKSFEHATLNSIADYALVGMGVLAPELFELRGVGPELIKDTTQHFAELGISQEGMLRLFGEQQKTGLFWHRWKTTSVDRGPLTDLEIRAFVTELLRKDRERLLAAFDYGVFFEGSKQLSAEWKAARGEARDVESYAMRVHAGEMLHDEDLNKVIVALASGPWYAELDRLLGRRR
ncbi:MAG: hypothetical protein QX199_18625, partial [Methylococcaceae bacterium]